MKQSSEDNYKVLPIRNMINPLMDITDREKNSIGSSIVWKSGNITEQSQAALAYDCHDRFAGSLMDVTVAYKV